MNKKIFVLFILLFMTGCSCEYSLTIDGNNYKENIVLTSDNSNEISSFNNKWVIPSDKDNYIESSVSDSEIDDYSNIYDYNLSNNKLSFNYDFSKSNYSNSTAVFKCYNRLSVIDYDLTTIISTNEKNDCFNKYPPLSSIKVTIYVDRDVISNNADMVNGNTYVWNINKNNADSKSINLVLDNNSKLVNDDNETIDEDKNINNKFSLDNYILYIFLFVIVLIIYFGYKWFMKFKEKNNDID